jgi:hypothetical protein
LSICFPSLSAHHFLLLPFTFRLLLIPLLQHQPSRPVLPVLLDLLLLQHAECFTWEIVAAYGVFGVNAKRVAEFVAGETVEACAVELKAKARKGARFHSKFFWINLKYPATSEQARIPQGVLDFQLLL